MASKRLDEDFAAENTDKKRKQVRVWVDGWYVVSHCQHGFLCLCLLGIRHFIFIHMEKHKIRSNLDLYLLLQISVTDFLDLDLGSVDQRSFQR